LSVLVSSLWAVTQHPGAGEPVHQTLMQSRLPLADGRERGMPRVPGLPQLAAAAIQRLGLARHRGVFHPQEPEVVPPVPPRRDHQHLASVVRNGLEQLQS